MELFRHVLLIAFVSSLSLSLFVDAHSSSSSSSSSSSDGGAPCDAARCVSPSHPLPECHVWSCWLPYSSGKLECSKVRVDANTPCGTNNTGRCDALGQCWNAAAGDAKLNGWPACYGCIDERLANVRARVLVPSVDFPFTVTAPGLYRLPAGTDFTWTPTGNDTSLLSVVNVTAGVVLDLRGATVRQNTTTTERGVSAVRMASATNVVVLGGTADGFAPESTTRPRAGVIDGSDSANVSVCGTVVSNARLLDAVQPLGGRFDSFRFAPAASGVSALTGPCFNVAVVGCTARNMAATLTVTTDGLSVRACRNVVVDGFVAHDISTSGARTLSSAADGVNIDAACDTCTVRNVSAYNIASSYSANGVLLACTNALMESSNVHDIAGNGTTIGYFANSPFGNSTWRSLVADGIHSSCNDAHGYALFLTANNALCNNVTLDGCTARNVLARCYNDTATAATYFTEKATGFELLSSGVNVTGWNVLNSLAENIEATNPRNVHAGGFSFARTTGSSGATRCRANNITVRGNTSPIGMAFGFGPANTLFATVTLSSCVATNVQSLVNRSDAMPPQAVGFETSNFYASTLYDCMAYNNTFGLRHVVNRTRDSINLSTFASTACIVPSVLAYSATVGRSNVVTNSIFVANTYGVADSTVLNTYAASDVVCSNSVADYYSTPLLPYDDSAMVGGGDGGGVDNEVEETLSRVDPIADAW
jgi:hypothetical protein